MSDPFVAEIRIFAGNFNPVGWATCDGQLMPLSQNTALFSLIGTFYGGDGKSTFALPNMAGSAPIAAGAGPGLTPRSLGEAAGETSVLLTTLEIPAHNHALQASGQPGNRRPVAGNALARSTGANMYLPSGTSTPMAVQATSTTGGSLPHNNLQPYLAMTFIIALRGVFPSRG
jgi:microcystin-dependent protein